MPRREQTPREIKRKTKHEGDWRGCWFTPREAPPKRAVKKEEGEDLTRAFLVVRDDTADKVRNGVIQGIHQL